MLGRQREDTRVQGYAQKGEDMMIDGDETRRDDEMPRYQRAWRLGSGRLEHGLAA